MEFEKRKRMDMTMQGRKRQNSLNDVQSLDINYNGFQNYLSSPINEIQRNFLNAHPSNSIALAGMEPIPLQNTCYSTMTSLLDSNQLIDSTGTVSDDIKSLGSTRSTEKSELAWKPFGTVVTPELEMNFGLVPNTLSDFSTNQPSITDVKEYTSMKTQPTTSDLPCTFQFHQDSLHSKPSLSLETKPLHHVRSQSLSAMFDKGILNPQVPKIPRQRRFSENPPMEQKSDMENIPRKQTLKFDNDMYTPHWVRYHGSKKEGYCDLCKPGKWLQLKTSAFWY
jgi:hypothetical protein